MKSLRDRLDILEEDLLNEHIRISAYHDLPFAIFCYDPEEEYRLRKEAVFLKTRIENKGKEVKIISIAGLMWEGIEKTRGINYVIDTEKKFGFKMAQTTVNNLLSKLSPLHKIVLEKMKDLNEKKDIVFLIRSGALAPSIYRMSKLLDEMHGFTMVPVILFYPGKREGETDLRFMGIGGKEGSSCYNYRVKIY
ncbi:MAG: BREX protein BrxB domain-containing protein [Candidatus Eremiobacterota bacterium]